MGRNPAKVDAELVGLVCERSRGAGEVEVRAALAPLTAAEEKVLRRALRNAPARTSLGPFSWADIARGVPAEVAKAREVGGYYALQAERDTLAAMLNRTGEKDPARAPAVTEEPDQRETEPAARKKAARPARAARSSTSSRRTQELLGLFAYHRDAPLVARALRVSLADLTEELDRLKIRRQAFRLARGTDHDSPAASPVTKGRSGPPVRRRPKSAAPPEIAVEPPPPSARDSQAQELKALLSEVGARRVVLAARLGTAGVPLSDAALLARFRAAGLEREFSLRERDLIRAMWSKHRAAETRVAAELSTTPSELRRIAVDRGITRELDTLRERLRRNAREKKWPGARIEQVLHKRDELRDLGLLEELDREVKARAGVIWKSLAGRKDALELLAKKLHLTADDAIRLQRLLDLR